MRRLAVLTAITLAATIAIGASTLSTAAGTVSAHGRRPATERVMQRYAADTWRSFDRMVDPRTGLPSDSIGGDLHPRTRSAFTSPTNIGMYLWATIAARDLGLISDRDARQRMRTTVKSIERLERHEPSGQFYNWYDPRTLEIITIWPEDGGVVYPFMSSVDNGWLAAALLMVAEAEPRLRDRATSLASSMDFGCYYDELAKPDGAGLIRGGFWTEADRPPAADGDPANNVPPYPRGDYCDMGEAVVYTGHHYGAFNTEPRIASYIGIALGQIPAEHYFGPWRTFPDTCDWAWTERRPIGEWHNYAGIDVFEGAFPYDDQLVVPTWGGSMFEAMMVPLVVPEEEWGPDSWAVTHPLYVESQIEFGLDEAGYGFWGFSPASNPAGGYREYGVDAIGIEPNGYAADVDRMTLVDDGWDDPGCNREPVAIAGYGQGVVTPHAAFLALDSAPAAALENLANLKAAFPDLYGRGGFKDSVDVATGQVADRYLSLDQGMVIAALANELLDDQFQDYLAVTLQPALQPLMAVEVFGAGRIAP